jgi:hypothetical protein
MKEDGFRVKYGESRGAALKYQRRKSKTARE